MTRTTRQQVNKKHSGDVIFSNDGPGGMALGNPIIMDKISSYLGNKDLCHWYASSRTFRDIIQEMDDSTWRRRTQKLAEALNMQIPPERRFREMFPIFKKEVDSLISRIHGPGNMINGLTLELVRAAARLAHFGQIGFDHLILRHHDLSTIPGEHLCSLASSVRNIFDIMGVKGCDLVKMIDSVKCSELCISKQILDREATEAVVRAMDTRIEVAELEHRFGGEDTKWKLDTEALTKYNGKGSCKSIILWARKADKYRQWLRDWAQDRDWSVANDGECLILKISI